jgi:hypothetical protein
MSSRGTRSWPAFRSDGRVLRFVTSENRLSVGSKAVGKPDKTPLFDLVRQHFWSPRAILRALRSRLQTALLQINRSPIAKLQPNTLSCRRAKRFHFQKLARDGPTQ